MSQYPLILASASPRRRKILEGMGLTFDVVIPEVEEIHWVADPAGTVAENAARKCRWACERHALSRVIAADTVVVFGGSCIGKPVDRKDATAMLMAFSGKCQTVFTGVAMCRPQRPLLQTTVTSQVYFRELTPDVIEEYITRVDPLDKAGGYDIDQYSDLIIRGYEGSWTNIMGLPQDDVEEWLACK
jgi:septum formation protein